MTIREGRWDCSSCGTKAVMGRYKFCPHCGSPRPENVRFYLPEGEPEVTELTLLELAKSGPDWTCVACGQDNAGTALFCGMCGSPRGESKSREVRTYSIEEIPRSEDLPIKEEYHWEEAQASRTGILSRLRAWRLKVPAVMGLVIAALGVVGFLVFGTRSERLTVTGHSWERVVAIEEYRTVVEEDWVVPTGGRYLSERQAIHHYDTMAVGSHQESYQDCQQVQTGSETYTCGSRDLGNGFFEDVTCTRPVYSTVCQTSSRTVTDYEQVPVYQTKYTYEIERWVWDRNEVTSGHDLVPYWPEFALGENEREAGRSEDYRVVFADGEGKMYEYTTEQDSWITYQVGASYKAKINHLGQIREIESDS